MIDPGRIEAIIKLPCLVIKKQILGFFRIMAFCRLWFPGLGELTKPLTEASNNENRTCRMGPREGTSF